MIEHLSGGDTTVMVSSSNAYSQRSANITDSRKILSFNLGDDFFEKPWVSKKASTQTRDGLGPLFNNNACQNCHIRDGRGHAPNVSETEDGTVFSSLLIKAVRTNIGQNHTEAMLNGTLENVGDSSVGTQLQHRTNLGIKKEINQRVSYETVTVTFSDGFSVHLRKPLWHLNSNYLDNGYDFDSDTIFSARVAPPMIGLGLLSEIDENDILSNEDINDANNDGISGKANRVFDIVNNSVTLGRFGWKATQPSIRQQSADAFLNDMGLTSELFLNENCMPHQVDCVNSLNGNGDQNENYPFEVSNKTLNHITFYATNLAVPARRNAYQNDVQQGKALFNKLGCQSCHVASYTTLDSKENIEQSQQVIYPYTDLLLHDMGPELADFTLTNQAASGETLTNYQATATEWRTPPLWGIGLAHTVDSRATFLHDGRARTILEAILWHGGEAENAKQKTLALSAKERELLLTFLNDL